MPVGWLAVLDGRVLIECNTSDRRPTCPDYWRTQPNVYRHQNKSSAKAQTWRAPPWASWQATKDGIFLGGSFSNISPDW
jgi:hypothetical protein